MFRSVLLSLLLSTMMFHKEHQKRRSVCDFCHICIEKNKDENNYHAQQPTSEEESNFSYHCHTVSNNLGA